MMIFPKSHIKWLILLRYFTKNQNFHWKSQGLMDGLLSGSESSKPLVQSLCMMWVFQLKYAK